MQVIDFIKEHGVEALTTELGIKVKDYPEHNLMVLNYCQIDSPKTNPIVMECRGLILQKDDLTVLCRPFNRFFNAGEAPETVEDFDITRAVAFEKIDGSLIKIWFNPMTNWWECATRGTAFAESECNGFDLTFRDLIHRALGCANHEEFDTLCRKHLDKGFTFLFELTSIENRVVRRYEGTKLWYLGARINQLGTDMTNTDLHGRAVAFCGHEPKQFTFDTLEHALEASQGLKDLDEGYVLVDMHTAKRIKIKSPAYVAVHHLRGEGLNPKRVKELVLTNEQDEYLKYFPEDEWMITPYVDSLATMMGCIKHTWYLHEDTVEQKDFALAVKDFCYSAVLFQARSRELTPEEVWSKSDQRFKYKIFTSFLANVLEL